MTFVPLTDEQLADLEAKVGSIYLFTAKARPKSRWAPEKAPAPEPPYQVVFRVANPGEYKHFRAQANNPATKAGAQETLARASIVAVVFNGAAVLHDGIVRGAGERAVKEAFNDLLTKWPGAPEAVAEGLLELNGVAQDESEKG